MAYSKTESKVLIADMPNAPGIYQMFDQQEQLLYVGKARNLKRRVASYFQTNRLTTRLISLMNKVAQIQITVTASEIEALLLEQNLIKECVPKYNILLRDDKSFPGIRLSDGDFPRIRLHRGTKHSGGRFFGPYPNASAVHQSLSFLHKTFKLRQCEDTVFKNRSRPCLQYQIGRCSAPCVGYITKKDYARNVEDVVLFLGGKDRALLDDLANRMEQSSKKQDYEQALLWRDRIRALNHLQQQQYIDGEGGDVDIIAAANEGRDVCVQVLFVRGGRVLGSRSYFPKFSLDEDIATVLASFMSYYYLGNTGARIPQSIIASHAVAQCNLLETALSNHIKCPVKILSRVRGARARWLKTTRTAAANNLMVRFSNKGRADEQNTALRKLLGSKEDISRIECFDISHHSGHETVASCVVFDQGVPNKKEYRRLNIKDITAADDYAAMHQALLRRYTSLLESEARLPELIVVDGGRGQLKQASKVCAELGLQDVILLGVAKGVNRREGEETLFLETGILDWTDKDNQAMQLIRSVRNEAHRFAITGHRNQKTKRLEVSVLEEITGVGPKRRKELYRHFGGIRGLYSASAEDIARVPGISLQLAEQIHAYLNVSAKQQKSNNSNTARY